MVANDGDCDGSDRVILDHAGSGRTIPGSATDGDMSVTGLTLTNGDDVGSGMHTRELATVSVEDEVVTGTSSATTGGGMHARSEVGTWTRVDFDINTSESGGGLTVSTDTDGIVCTDCSWTDNTATTGGAISVSSGTFEIDNGTFSGNSPTSSRPWTRTRRRARRWT